jgi:hypothetical protein
MTTTKMSAMPKMNVCNDNDLGRSLNLNLTCYKNVGSFEDENSWNLCHWVWVPI